MSFPLQPQTIRALADVISGGPAYSDPIGIYRTGPEIERFMMGCNVSYRHTGSRYQTLAGRLIEINSSPKAEVLLRRLLEAAVNPSDFSDDAERYDAVLKYMNNSLRVDGLELRLIGHRVRLLAAGQSTPAVEQLSNRVATIDFDTVQLGLQRAQDNIENDPEDAITAACSMVESVCKSILIELGEPLPANKDIQSLFNTVRQPLGLNPGRSDWDVEIANDVRMALGGLATSVQGIGALRTHSGDAHGPESGRPRVDARIARFAVNAASAVALFLIETWQWKYPQRVLREVGVNDSREKS